MRVLIADDNNEIRSALRLVLGELRDDRSPQAGGEAGGRASRLLVLEAADAGTLLAQIWQAPEPGIDLVLLDWELPGLDPILVLAEMEKRCPQCQVVAMSARPEAEEESLHLGASHFIPKHDPPERLLAYLRGAMAG